MPQTYEVELEDGRVVEIESDFEPTESDVMTALQGMATSEIRSQPEATPAEASLPWDSGFSPTRIDSSQALAEQFGQYPSPEGGQVSMDRQMLSGISPVSQRQQEITSGMQAAREEEVPTALRLGAAAHTGLLKGAQLPSTLVRSAMAFGEELPSAALVRGITRQIPFVGGMQEAASASNRKYFEDVAKWEKWMSERDAMLGAPTFGTEVTEGTFRAFAELPVQLMGGAGGATTAAAVRGSAITAGLTSGLQRFGQETGEGADWITAAARGGTSGLVNAMSTRAFGATGVESIFRKEGVGGIVNRLVRVGREAGMEGIEEASAQIQEELADYIQKNPDRPISEAVRNVMLAGTVGAVLGGGIGALTTRGGRDASQVQEAAAVHGDVRPQPSPPEVGQVPVEEGGPGVQPQAQERVPLTLRGPVRVGETMGQQPTGPMTEAETAQFGQLQNKFYGSQDMTSEELDTFNRLESRRRSQAPAPPPAAGGVSETRAMVDEAVKQQQLVGMVEFVDPAKITPDNPLSGRVAQFNPVTGKIEVNESALAGDLAMLPPEERAEAASRIINEEMIHSYTDRNDAEDFANEASWVERRLATRIYTGNWSGSLGGEPISNVNLGYEMMRRRIQVMMKLSPSELVATVGRERWKVRQLDRLERSVFQLRRQLLRTNASKRQIEMLDNLANKIGIAKQSAVAEGGAAGEREGEIGAPIRGGISETRKHISDFNVSLGKLTDDYNKARTPDEAEAAYIKLESALNDEIDLAAFRLVSAKGGEGSSNWNLWDRHNSDISKKREESYRNYQQRWGGGQQAFPAAPIRRLESAEDVINAPRGTEEFDADAVAEMPDSEVARLFTQKGATGEQAYSPQYGSVVWGAKQPRSQISKLESLRDAAQKRMMSELARGAKADNTKIMAEQGRMLWYSGALEGVRREGGNYRAVLERGDIRPDPDKIPPPSVGAIRRRGGQDEFDFTGQFGEPSPERGAEPESPPTEPFEFKGLGPDFPRLPKTPSAPPMDSMLRDAVLLAWQQIRRDFDAKASKTMREENAADDAFLEAHYGMPAENLTNPFEDAVWNLASMPTEDWPLSPRNKEALVKYFDSAKGTQHDRVKLAEGYLSGLDYWMREVIDKRDVLKAAKRGYDLFKDAEVHGDIGTAKELSAQLFLPPGKSLQDVNNLIAFYDGEWQRYRDEKKELTSLVNRLRGETVGAPIRSSIKLNDRQIEKHHKLMGALKKLNKVSVKVLNDAIYRKDRNAAAKAFAAAMPPEKISQSLWATWNAFFNKWQYLDHSERIEILGQEMDEAMDEFANQWMGSDEKVMQYTHDILQPFVGEGQQPESDEMAFPAAPRRGMTKKEAQRIEEQRKYREAMGQAPVTEKGLASGSEKRKVRAASRVPAAHYFPPPTPESIEATAGEVLSDQFRVPSFQRFMDFVRSKHGDIQPGQVAESWSQNVWKYLESASGEQLKSLVDRLGLRRQVFGKVKRQGETVQLTGDIADPGIEEAVSSPLAKARARIDRLTKKATEFELQARRFLPGSKDNLKFKQLAEISRRAIDSITRGLQTGEGIELAQETLFPGIEARTSQLTGERVPVPGKPGQFKYVGRKSTIPEIGGKSAKTGARFRAISAIGRLLISERPSLRSGLNRSEITPDDVRWNEMGAELYKVTADDLEDRGELGLMLTQQAATDASTQRIAAGGRIKIKEKALPRSATKRVVAMLDKRSGRVYLVSAYRDGRRGPVFRDPHSITGEHRTLDDLISRFQPLYSIPLDMPVQNFTQVFASTDDFAERFYNQIEETAKRVGWRGYGTEPEIEGTEALEGEGGFVQGPDADLIRAETGMTSGAMQSGAEITPLEARTLYSRFRHLETFDDVKTMIADLKSRISRQADLEPKFIRGMEIEREMSLVRNELLDEVGARRDTLERRLATLTESKKKLGLPEDWKLPIKDELTVLGITKIANAIEALHEGEDLTVGEIAELTLQEIYGLAKRTETERAFVAASEREFAKGRREAAQVGPQEARPSPFSRELTMPIERVPPTVVRPEQLPPGTQPVQRRPAPPVTEVGGGLTPPPGEAQRTDSQRRRLERLIRFKQMREEQKVVSGPKKAEFTGIAETPGPRETYGMTPQKKAEIALRISEVANRVAQRASEPTPQEPAGPEQQTFGMKGRGIGALRRSKENEGITLTSPHGNRQGDKIRIDKMLDGDLWKAVYFKAVGRNDYQIWDSRLFKSREDAIKSSQGVQGIEIPNQRIPGAPHPFGDSSFTEGYPITNETIGAIRRSTNRTAGEVVSNILMDFGSIYDRWMVDRIAEYGGPVAKMAAEGFNFIIDRQKELYGQLTPLLDQARKLSGGIQPRQATGIVGRIAELPRRTAESAKAMRSAVWLNGLTHITPHTAVARSVDAIEGKIAIPTWAQNLVDTAKAANMEIGMMLQSVIPGFVASGKFQRNMTSLGYDIVRMGGGDLWDRWTHGVWAANIRHGANLRRVRTYFRLMKRILDDPSSSGADIERINQDMARRYPEVVTHIKQYGMWKPVVHSDLFGYLENAAQRATHVRAFREQFPNTVAGRNNLRQLMEEVRADTPGEVHHDLDALMRAMHGHPTDDYGSRMLADLQMGPQQFGGHVLRLMNQTVNNLLAKMVLTGQVFVQPGEVAAGSTPIFLGYRNYLRAAARLRHLYKELELMGAVNLVMHDYTFNPNSPIRSMFKITGNVLSKVTAEAMMNELQEGMAAATARITAEDILTGNLDKWQRSMLPQTFKIMGFNPGEVQRLMQGDPELLNQFQRKAASFLTGGNKSIAEGSRLGAARWFSSIFRFQTYPAMKLNQLRGVTVNFVDAMRTGTPQERVNAARLLGRTVFGNALQGAITTALVTLAYAGKEGLKIKKEEAKDEPWWFLAEMFLSTMSGPMYLVYRGAKHKGLAGVGEQAARAAFPYGALNDLRDAAFGMGQYRDQDWQQRLGRFLKNKTPITRAISTGLAMAGLANRSQPLDVAIQGLNRWKLDTFTGEAGKPSTYEEGEQFRIEVRKAIEAMKSGDDEEFLNAWLRAADVSDASSVSDSLKARKVLRGPNGRKLTEEEVEALQERIGFDAYDRLEYYDIMLDAAADGLMLEP